MLNGSYNLLTTVLKLKNRMAANAGLRMVVNAPVDYLCDGMAG